MPSFYYLAAVVAQQVIGVTLVGGFSDKFGDLGVLVITTKFLWLTRLTIQGKKLRHSTAKSFITSDDQTRPIRDVK